MRRYALTVAVLISLIVAAGCTRTTEETIVDRHRVDTEFIVE